MPPNENPGAGGTVHGVAEGVRGANAPELEPNAADVNSSIAIEFVGTSVARCQARATLYAAGEIPNLHEAVQQVMSEAFRPVRAGEVS
jgi:hypothetical protein